MINLYRWQKEALKRWKNNAYHGVFDVVTGVGKTVFALAAAESLRNEGIPLRVRIVVPRVSLIKQRRKEIITYFPEKEFKANGTGVIGGGRNGSFNADFTLYMVNSAHYCLSRNIREDCREGFGTLLICDECHYYGSPCNKAILRFLENKDYDRNKYYSIGLSATPSNKYLEDVLIPSLGEVIYHYDFHKAVCEKNVSDFAIFNIALDLTSEEIERYAKVTEKITVTYRKMLKEYPEIKNMGADELFGFCNSFLTEEHDSLPAVFALLIRKRRDLINNSKARNACVRDIVAEVYEENRIIIFCEKIEQCEEIYV